MDLGRVSGDTLAFIIESQRRIISHCEKLSATSDLPAGDRARLLHLRDDAEAGLGRLTFAEAA
jgi:hypothetical protein